jgi:poly(3-hydroxyalkanoate) synthetase
MNQLSWQEYLTLNEGSKSLEELMRDYQLYQIQTEQLPQYSYNFLLNFFLQNHKGNGGILEEETIQPFSGFILQENGDYLLQENGDRIYL